jgi:hypothetical protein
VYHYWYIRETPLRGVGGLSAVVLTFLGVTCNAYARSLPESTLSRGVLTARSAC